MFYVDANKFTKEIDVDLLRPYSYIHQNRTFIPNTVKTMILHSIGQFLALNFYKIGDRFKHKHESVSIFDQIKNASKICVFAPADQEQLNSAKPILSKLCEIFPNGKGFLIIQQDLQTKGLSLANYEFVLLEEQKRSLFGMPDKSVKNKLKNSNYDVVLDLSVDYNFDNLSLGWNVNSPLRISFSHPKREKFYNFIIRQGQETSNEHAFKSLSSYLGLKS